MAYPQVANELVGVWIWRIVVNVLNKRSADKGYPLPQCKRLACYRVSEVAFMGTSNVFLCRLQ